MKELRMDIGRGQILCFESHTVNPQGCSYVRILRTGPGNTSLSDWCDEGEVAYWSSEEWAEDPQGVMGAIMGCIYHGAESFQKGEHKKKS